MHIVRLNISVMKNRTHGAQENRQGQRARRLVRLNRRITKLSSELETLQFMQDRLERELESGKAGDYDKRI